MYLGEHVGWIHTYWEWVEAKGKVLEGKKDISTNEQRIGRLITSLFSRKNAIGPIPIVSSCPRRVSMCQDDIRPNASHCSTYPFNTDKQFSLLESTKRETERDRRGYIKRRRRNNI